MKLHGLQRNYIKYKIQYGNIDYLLRTLDLLPHKS